ncbi:hypothetical protein [Calothrix rhizosoleniae]|uniref:hypothetical protein n=1 Tax=Calothrix rhizosoleniae TaxID=888997 RepID=UPI0013562EBB|nr:hypothetical protein [Calothrix rhizosoleniae]
MVVTVISSEAEAGTKFSLSSDLIREHPTLAKFCSDILYHFEKRMRQMGRARHQ